MLDHRFNDRPMNWYDANRFCRSQKAKLVEIESSRENREISEEIRRRGFNQQKKQFWLGLTDIRKEGQWVSESTLRVYVFSFFIEHSHFSEAKIYKLGFPSAG